MSVCACACVCVFYSKYRTNNPAKKCTTWTGNWITLVLTRRAAAESQGGVVTALNLTHLYRSSTRNAIHALGSVPACPASGVEAARAATLTCIRPSVGQKGIAQVCSASSHSVPERTTCWTHGKRGLDDSGEVGGDRGAVSYTHLTLPTRR